MIRIDTERCAGRGVIHTARTAAAGAGRARLPCRGNAVALAVQIPMAIAMGIPGAPVPFPAEGLSAGRTGRKRGGE